MKRCNYYKNWAFSDFPLLATLQTARANHSQVTIPETSGSSNWTASGCPRACHSCQDVLKRTAFSATFASFRCLLFRLFVRLHVHCFVRQLILSSYPPTLAIIVDGFCSFLGLLSASSCNCQRSEKRSVLSDAKVWFANVPWTRIFPCGTRQV